MNDESERVQKTTQELIERFNSEINEQQVQKKIAQAQQAKQDEAEILKSRQSKKKEEDLLNTAVHERNIYNEAYAAREAEQENSTGMSKVEKKREEQRKKVNDPFYNYNIETSTGGEGKNERWKNNNKKTSQSK
ncbi:hypothetical protein FACS189465_0890 [Clostridia bacterium]|nr:hypothetical protein FACS189465_0890 [Clostridia bacterium]